MDKYQSNDRMQLSVTAVLAGVFATLSLIVVLSVLSAAVGLIGEDFKWGLFLPLTLLIVVLPFLAGGWIASRVSLQQSRTLQAFCVWSVVTVVMSAVIGSQASAFAGGVLKQFGVAAGANLGAGAMLDQLRELKPSLVTKVELKEGKATTTLILKDPGPMSKEAVQAGKEEMDETFSGATTSAEDSDTLAAVQPKAQQAAATASWALLSALVVSLIASVVGARISKSVGRE